MSNHDVSQPTPAPAMRLIFEYDGDQVRLVSQQPVNMAIGGFAVPRAPHPGYYIDTRDAAGKTLARVPAREAFSGSAEVFPERPGAPISRIDVPRPRGAFTVVVPAPAGADHVSVVRVAEREPTPVGRAAGAAQAAAVVTDIAKFPLQTGR